MRKYLLLLSILFLVSCITNEKVRPVYDLTERLLPGKSNYFEFVLNKSDVDFFELESDAKKIIIRGNNNGSLARGLNHYLKNYCHLSASICGNNLSFPDTLPQIAEKIRIESSVPYRYYLNYCTYSYSMPFWGWSEWEKEIDRMALQGVNMPLMAVYSQYAVWQNTLKRLNYTDKEILDFLPGAGYEAWWLMGNLEGFGGPITQQFIDNQTELQKKMLSRMRDFGMKPVFQGFYGMVPNSLKDKYPDAHIIDQGQWLQYQRPAILDPTDPLFDTIAQIYYEEQKKLFGEAPFYGGDPFHEGGITTGIDVKAAAENIMKSMRKSNPASVWILQGWQQNPKTEIMEGLKKGEAIILDLMACELPQWNKRKGGHMHHDWIWCALPNFGGKVGLHGIMSSYATGPVKAMNSEVGKNICGVGTAPEGIGTVPVVYDMVYDMAWRTDTIDTDSWLENYSYYRYGKENEDCNKAWKKLSRSIYECHNKAGGPIESYLCARPQDTIKCVSAWGNAKFFYNPDDVKKAWDDMYKAKDIFSGSDTYAYDLTDLTRQVLSDYAKLIHTRMVEAFNQKNKATFATESQKFLQLIKDVDRLLSTRKEFLLGTWVAQAEAKGTTPAEKKQFVINAKRQITTWNAIDSRLHDYAHKEWSGLLTDFYLPRWEAYVMYKTHLLDGIDTPEPDYAKMELEWVETDTSFPVKENPEGSMKVIEDIYKSYSNEITNAYQQN